MKRLAWVLWLCVSWSALADDKVSLVLSDVRLIDLVRITFSEIKREPFVVAHEVLEANERYTVDLQGMPALRVVSAVSDLAKSAGFDVTRRNGVVWIGNPVQSVDYKQSGVILTATPEIREDVIELSLNQELSNFVVTKTGVNGSPTLIKRSVNTKLGLVPGEVVVLAGLQDDQEDESHNRVPFFGWLIGQERQQKQSEILVFIEVVRL